MPLWQRMIWPLVVSIPDQAAADFEEVVGLRWGRARRSAGGYASLVFAPGGILIRLVISNILAFSVLALKVHRYLDGERLARH